MRRREFVTLIGGAVTWPLAARAQQPRLPTIGWLSGRRAEQSADTTAAFRRGLGEVGFFEGQNVLIDYVWADNHIDRFPALVSELLSRRVDVITTGGSTPAALTAKAATTTVPILFSTSTDPVELGLVNSLNRPGGNLTGVSTLGALLGQKRLELLRELRPQATTFGLLVNPANAASQQARREVEAAAGVLDIKVQVVQAKSESELEQAFSNLNQLRPDGLVVGADGFFTTLAEKLGALSLQFRIPTIYQYLEFAAAGGLISYGASFLDGLRILGVYAGRILKGEKPCDLPVLQPTKFDLIINLKTAKALGVAVPSTLLALADEVIE